MIMQDIRSDRILLFIQTFFITLQDVKKFQVLTAEMLMWANILNILYALWYSCNLLGYLNQKYCMSVIVSMAGLPITLSETALVFLCVTDLIDKQFQSLSMLNVLTAKWPKTDEGGNSSSMAYVP